MLLPHGPTNARLMIVVDRVSPRDLYSRTILCDREFDKMLMEAGGNRASCFVTALVRKETPYNQPPYIAIAECLPILEAEIDRVKPQIILAIGELALQTLTGKKGLSKWRSSILDYQSPGGHSCHVIATYDLAYLYKVWSDRTTIVHDIRKAWKLGHRAEPIKPPAYDFIIEPSFSLTVSTINNLIKRVSAGPTKLSVDIETRGGHIACIGFAWSDTEAICIPLLRAINPLLWDQQKHRVHYWMEAEEVFITHLLYRLLTHPNCQVIGQNFLYDAQYFYRWLLFIPNVVRDTMITQHTMLSWQEKGLDFLSSLYAAYHLYWKDESKDWHPKLGERQLWIYNCKDCCITYEVDSRQQELIASLATNWPELPSIHNFQQSLFYPVLHSMNLGLRVDSSSKQQLSDELRIAIEKREAWMEEVLGQKVNIKSPKQMKDLFYRVLNQPEIISRQTKKATVDDAALEKLSSREPLLLPLCDKVRELRSLGVFRSTFLEAETDTDERMRCSFNIGGTVTYRFSSSGNAFGSGMNLQNIPSGDDEDEETDDPLPNVRALFLPDPGFEFFDIDLDSADLRIVVAESGCAEMQKWFDAGLKPYVEIAKEYFQDPSITKSHDAYKAFKVICHATNYLGKGPTILNRMPKSAKLGNNLQADSINSIQQWYFSKFPEISEWHKRVISQINSKRFVSNIFGYRIWAEGRIDDHAYKALIAAIPQSTVACLINRAYKAIYDNEPSIQLLLQVHDSLAGQYPIETRSQSIEAILKHSSIPLPYSQPLIIPVGVKVSTNSWGECVEFKRQ